MIFPQKPRWAVVGMISLKYSAIYRQNIFPSVFYHFRKYHHKKVIP